MAIQKEQLKEIYKGDFKKRVRHFDDGGYANYVTGSGTSDSSSAPYTGYQLPSNNNNDSIYGTSGINDGPYATTFEPGNNSGPVTPAEVAALTGANTPGSGVNSPLDLSQTPTPSVTTVDTGDNGTTGSSGAGTAAGGALGALLKALGLGGSNSTSALTALAGLASAAGAYKRNAAYSPTYRPPAAFSPAATTTGASGSTGQSGYGPAGGYNKANYANATAGTPGLGYTPRTQANPMIPNYYTYGQSPQSSFFTGSAAPATSNPPLVNMAKGGHAKRFDAGGSSMLGPGTPFTGQTQMGGIPATPGALPTNSTPNMSGPFLGMPKPVATPGNISAPMSAAPIAAATRPGMPATMPQRPMPRPGMPMQRPAVPAGNIVHRASGGEANPPVASSSAQLSGISNWLGGQRKAGTPSRVPVQTNPTPGNGLAGGGMPSRHVKGPGDGTSDDIPARLANGEYVIDAQTVAMLGNGDNGAGAKNLDKFRENIRMHKGASLAKGKMAPDAKDPQAYLPRGEQ